MLNFFLFSLLIYASMVLLVFFIAMAYETLDCFTFRDFDWEGVGDVTGLTASVLAPIFVFANLVKFFSVAYYWFFEV